jgi:general stress protein YciG
MTREEAGRKGAEALNADPSKKSEASRKAAETRGHEAMAAMGQKGGKALASDPTKKSEASRKAAETRGHEAMAEMGRKGGEHSHGGGRRSDIEEE